MLIQDLIKSEIEKVQREKIKITDRVYFNQYETLQRINSYLNDKYLEGDQDRIFWNLYTPRRIHLAKNIDTDSKDYMPIGLGNTNFIQSWILKIKFRRWVKDYGFAFLLNDISEALADFGSVILKKVKVDDVFKLDMPKLDNMFFDPTVKDIRDSAFIVEKHFLNAYELKQKKDVWENVDEVLKNGERVDSDHLSPYVIYERFGLVDEDGETKYKHTIVSFGKTDKNNNVLYDVEVDKEDCPYFDLHIGRYTGRWLRIGGVERLFKLQERVNALVNQNAKTSEIASLLLLRTSDPNTRGNVLSGLESGEIINSADLQQIGIDNRSFSNFMNELVKIEEQADKLLGTPSIITGETMPSRTPFRGMAVMNNAAKSSFKFIQQNIGEKIANILMEHILPEIVKTWNNGEILEIAGDLDDIYIYDNLLLNKKLWEAMSDYWNKTKKLPSAQQLQQLATRLVEEFGKDKRKIEIPKGFFNFKYGIDMNVTDESQDKGIMNEALDNAINWVLTNPNIINNPLFRQKLENNGITPPIFENKLMQPNQFQKVPLQEGRPIEVTPPDKLLNQVQK